MNFFIITSTEDTASMNIRDKLLNSESYQFKEISDKWYENQLYVLEGTDLLSDTNVYLGLTDKRMVFLDDLKLSDLRFKPDYIINNPKV